MKRIIIGADIVPTDSNQTMFSQADIDSLIGNDLHKRFQEASFIAMNLEVPLVDSADPITKCGPNLIAPSNTIQGIKAINPYFLTLANNHIMDQGIGGLRSTVNILSCNGIDFSGVGENLSKAREPYIRTIDDVRLGVYCCTEHEYSIATNTQAGANPYDPLFSFDDVRELKKACDYVIVLYHGGKEHYRYPSPLLQKVFHKFAEVGADLVIAQHTHCIGCMEKYGGSTLVYGQGNFLFDHSKSDYWRTSILIEVDLESRTVDFIPIVKIDNYVREAKDQERETILREFYNRSNDILKEGFIESKYRELAEEMLTGYLLRFSGGFSNNIIIRVLLRLTHLNWLKKIYRRKTRIGIENVLDCEAHRELAAESMRISD